MDRMLENAIDRGNVPSLSGHQGLGLRKKGRKNKHVDGKNEVPHLYSLSYLKNLIKTS